MKAMPVIVLLFLMPCIFAQDKDPTPTPRKGSITGRIIAEDGQPMSNVQIYIYVVGVSGGATRTFTSDDEGNFTVDGLASGTYAIGAAAPAYIAENSSDPEKQRLYRPGETAIISLRKGGVITGQITNQKGDPIQGMPVSAMRVRDEAGRKVPTADTREARTDDRGIYRIYGLQSGAYLISASNGRGNSGFSDLPYDEATPVYYPASTRETATEVKVQAGEEVQGINLRFRYEKGYRISGTVTGLPLKSKAGELAYAGADVRLLRNGGEPEQRIYTYELQEQKSFVMRGVADGDYEIRATSYDWRNEDADIYASGKRRITVKGADVTGIVLAMVPLASVAGQVVIEPTSKDEKNSCPAIEPNSPAAFQEVLLSLRREADSQADSDAGNPRSSPNDKGEFKFRGLESVRYYVSARLPNEAWFIKSIKLKLPASAPKSSNQKSPAANDIDIGRQGLSPKPGDKLNGLTITVAEGAASLQGRVSANKDNAPPKRLRVHLVPAEKEAANELLRYYETTTEAEGRFTFTNLAPGSYWLLARPVLAAEADEAPPNPVAWNANERVKLRREAETTNNSVVLTPCQHLRDHALRHNSNISQ